MKKNEKDFIEEFVKGMTAGKFLKDLLRQSAVIRQLEITGKQQVMFRK